MIQTHGNSVLWKSSYGWRQPTVPHHYLTVLKREGREMERKKESEWITAAFIMFLQNFFYNLIS